MHHMRMTKTDLVMTVISMAVEGTLVVWVARKRKWGWWAL